MMDNEDTTILYNIVRIGKVSSVNTVNKTARVAFSDKPDTEGNPLISAPLNVINAELWFPSVGKFVLCLFLPNGESDGFVIGTI